MIPAKVEAIRSPVPMRRFRYNARNDVLKCPHGKKLKPGRPVRHGRFFCSQAANCKRCSLASLCLFKGRVNKAVMVGDDYRALLRARRGANAGPRRISASPSAIAGARKAVTAKQRSGMAWRAVRRSLSNMRIQAFLTAAAINLKRLAAALLALLWPWLHQNHAPDRLAVRQAA